MASGPPLGLNAWLPVLVRFNGSHVDVHQNGIAHVTAAALDAPDPDADLGVGRTAEELASLAARAAAAARWRVGFGGGGGGVGDNLVGRLVLRSTSLTPNATLTMRVSPNGQQFAASAASFSYLPPAVPSSVSPSCGPYLGGTRLTVAGVYLRDGDDYR